MGEKLGLLQRHFLEFAIDNFPDRKRIVRFRINGVKYKIDVKQLLIQHIELLDAGS